MITSYKARFFLIIVLFFSSKATAANFPGGDITWKHLSGDTFEVYLTIFSDCNGIPITQMGTLQVTNLCNNTSTSVAFTSSSTMDATPVCDNACTRCSDPGCTDTRFGFRRQVYTTKVVLDPSKCCNWRFSFGRCCLPNTLSPVPSNTDFYTESWMDLCNVPGNNSSPQFLTDPPFLLTKNACTQINLAAHDEPRLGGDGDRLSYKLIKPLSANNTTISYNQGYSYDVPMTYNGTSPNSSWGDKCEGLHFDTAIAELRVKSIKEEATLLSYVVEEWRKDSSGILKQISSVRRSYAVYVEDGTETAPALTTLNDKFNYVFCAGREYSILINTFSLDQDNTILSLIGSVPGVTLITGSTKQQLSSLKWTPALSDARDEPYRIVIRGTKENCPNPVFKDITINVTVIDSVPAIYFKVDTLSGLRRFKFTPDSINSSFKYRWNFGDGDTSTSLYPEHVYSKDGEYYPKLTISYPEGCDASVTEKLLIAQCVSNAKPKVQVSAKEQVYYVCANEELCIPITATDADSLTDSISLSVDNYIMNWPSAKLNAQQIPGKTTGSFCFTPDTSFIGDDPHYTWLYATDSHDPCHDRDSVLVKIFVTPPVNADFTATEYFINPQTYYFAPEDLSFGKYEWNFGDGTTSEVIKPTHTYSNDGPYTVTLTVTSSSGCKVTSSRGIKVKSCQSNTAPVFAADNGKYDYSICEGELICIPVSAQDADSGDVIDLTWDSGNTKGTFTKPGQGKGEFCWQTTTADGSSTPYTFTMSAKDKCQVEKTLSFTINVTELPDASFAIQPTGELTLAFFPDVDTHVTYLWSFGDGDSSSDIKPVHTYEAPGKYEITLSVTDSNGCSSSSAMSHTIIITSINNEEDSYWKIYPNPVLEDRLVVESLRPLIGTVTIELFDLKGMQVFKLETAEKRNEIELPKNMEPGSYILRIIGSDNYNTELIIK